MKTVYVGCALRGVLPKDFPAFIGDLKEELSAKGFEVLSFVGLDPQASAREVYATDIACAESADIMVAICDYPSTGLGMEIQKRIDIGKETYICNKKGTNISRMVLGATEKFPFVHHIEYENISDIISEVDI